jgi:hypothetical protein
MCNYWHGGTIECRDDGYMWDADSDGFDPEDKSMPCPACNTRAWLLEAKETAESCSSMSSWNGTLSGEQVWLNAVHIAVSANGNAAPRILRQIGIARPIVDHPVDPSKFVEKFYDHRNTRRLVSRNRREQPQSRQNPTE